ncbi:hypothetical protein MSAN_01103400 [Mycena sanguinolenta]|uniref:Uncharacterized protein n=1 Tax=Mycena sanguinolenta TaxID=230812 RepID=A0A8H6YSL7_9AGAR|nr:hypothetical protein MSAN_01103400 [Mycena sanguinolenta]
MNAPPRTRHDSQPNFPRREWLYGDVAPQFVSLLEAAARAPRPTNLVTHLLPAPPLFPPVYRSLSYNPLKCRPPPAAKSTTNDAPAPRLPLTESEPATRPGRPHQDSERAHITHCLFFLIGLRRGFWFSGAKVWHRHRAPPGSQSPPYPCLRSATVSALPLNRSCSPRWLLVCYCQLRSLHSSLRFSLPAPRTSPAPVYDAPEAMRSF